MQNQVNIPYGMFGEIKDQTLYPKGHPYSWPTIGYVEIWIDGADDQRFFYALVRTKQYYLVVAEDVNAEDVLLLSEKYFGSIPRGQEVRD